MRVLRLAKAKWVLLGLAVAAGVLLTFPGAMADGAAIWTDKADYSPGETVTISGSGFLAGATVSISVARPNGVIDGFDAMADEAGGFNAAYALDGIEGTYTVMASDGTNTAATTFTDHIPVPTNLVATVASATQIGLSWNGPQPGGGANANHHYHVERCQGSGCTSFAEIGTTSTASGTPNTYSDGGLTPGTYRYRVRFHHHPSPAAFSGYSNIAQATIADTVPPTIATNPNLTVEGNALGGAVVVYTAPAASDNVDPSPTVVCAPGSGKFFPLGATAVTCTATDASGNSASSTFTVTVVDTTAPALSLPAGFTLEGNTLGGFSPVLFSTSASDVVWGAVGVVCSPLSGSFFALGPTPVTCSATDGSGNAANGGFTVTVVDTMAPAIGDNPDVTMEGNALGGAFVSFGLPAASDVVDPVVIAMCTPASGSFFALGGPATVTCSATDDSGNSASSTFLVTVVDTTPPSLALPASFTLEGNALGGYASVTWSATASDIVWGDMSASIVCTPASGSFFPLGTGSVTCTATDGSGNSASSTFAVSIVDTTAPSLSLPASFTLEGNTFGGYSPVIFSTSASDIVWGDVGVVCSATSGLFFALGPTPVTCSATDGSGNAASGGFAVTVVDTTPPSLDLPASFTLEGNALGGYDSVTWTATASDIVWGSVDVVCSVTSGSFFSLGITPATCSAMDGSGNTANGGFAVTVVDTTPPIVADNPDMTMEGNTLGGAFVNFGMPSASDAVDPVVIAMCTPGSDSFFALGGPATVTCTATDDSGNSASSTFLVTVVDTTPPSLALPTGIGPLEGNALGGYDSVTWTASAVDIVWGDVSTSIVCTPASGTFFPLGTGSVTCTATDGSGNSAASTFAVSIVDTTAPSLSLPASFTLEGNTFGGYSPVTFSTSAVDVVWGPVAVVCSSISGSFFALGPTPVTCSATDGSGNAASGGFAVTVVDTTPPVVSVPTDITISAGSPGGATVTYTASASDVVWGGLSVTCAPNSGSVFPIGNTGPGVTVVTCAATDGSRNTAGKTFQVTVVPPSAPLAGLVGCNLVVLGTNGADSVVVDTSNPVATSVKLNGAGAGTFALGADPCHVVVKGFDGDDSVTLSGGVSLEAYGGMGNDAITGGAGNDVLFGNAGNDDLTGAAGNDFLIAGSGDDRLVGSAGADILVAGDFTSAYTYAALRAISQSWAVDGVANADLADNNADGDIADTGTDKLTGASGRDWFIVSSEDTITDLPKTLANDGDKLTYV